MKLSNVVRGVKLMYDPTKSYQPDYPDGYTRGEVSAHNRLASAEVVVDREQIEDILDTAYHIGLDFSGICKIANSIATAIENGSIISLKGEE